MGNKKESEKKLEEFEKRIDEKQEEIERNWKKFLIFFVWKEVIITLFYFISLSGSLSCLPLRPLWLQWKITKFENLELKENNN